MELQKIMNWVLPSALIAGGFLIGIIFEKVIVKKLKSVALRTKWKGDEIIISSIHGVTTLWFVIAGIYVAILYIPINPTYLSLLQKILLVIIIFSGTLVIARIAAGFADIYANKVKGVLASTTIFLNLTKLLVFLIGILIILQTLGISISPILTALGIGGLAVALALQDTLSNLFSGLQIIASRQVRIGDYVKLNTGEEGYVTDITWRNTTIRAIPDNMIIVPNSKLASTILTNYHQPAKVMSVIVQIGVSYDSDLAKVEKVTLEVAKEILREIEGGIPDFEPFIRYHTFADFSINFNVILRAKEFFDQYLIKHEFIKRIHKRYKKEGIEIPFPIRTIHMESENT
jgi:small-conductance mechanosensitive channel